MQKQSSADISISMLIGGIACATMWLLYGLMLNDFYIYVSVLQDEKLINDLYRLDAPLIIWE